MMEANGIRRDDGGTLDRWLMEIRRLMEIRMKADGTLDRWLREIRREADGTGG